MPKVGHATIFEYKSRITDLESEVFTLKRRLEELRRAKMQAFYKQPVTMRRCSKSDITVPVEPTPQPPPPPADITAELTQKISKLQNELELAEIKYTRDTGELKDKIKKLQDEMLRVKESHQVEIEALNKEHFIALELLKKSHTEELALYEDNLSHDREARMNAENELNNYKLQLRPSSIQIPDIEQLKNELSRLQSAYEELKVQHEKEVSALENRIGELLADIAAHNEKSKRRFQLIPDRAYIVKTSSPTVSSSSIGSSSDKKSYVALNSVKSTTPRSLSSPDSRVAKKLNSATANMDSLPSKKSVSSQPPPTNSTHKLETINRQSAAVTAAKNSPPARPKSCATKKTTTIQPQERVSLCRPKSCWGDRKCNGSSSFKRSPTAGRPKFTKVTSKIDSGLADSPGPLFPECGAKYKPVRKGSLGSPVPPWQIPNNGIVKGNRNQGARSNGL